MPLPLQFNRPQVVEGSVAAVGSRSVCNYLVQPGSLLSAANRDGDEP